MKSSFSLPQNPDELREFALKLMQSLSVTEKALAASKDHVYQLEQALKNARQNRFGRKTEVFSQLQLSLLHEDCDTDIVSLELELNESLPPEQTKRAIPARKALPQNLPRKVTRLVIPTTICSDCGGDLRFLRDEVNETLDIIPAQFFVRQTIRPQYSCPCCQTIHSAELPRALIDKGQASAGLLAHIVVSKCLDHLPLNRQHNMFVREGITIPTSTLSEWMGKVGVALQPLVAVLQHTLIKQSVLHADETPLKILSSKKGCLSGYLWTYTSPLAADQQVVMYDCQPGRSGEYAKRFLTGFQGTLVVDDYAGYKALFAGGEITEAGCLTHVRRKFVDLYKVDKNPLAKQVVDSLRGLYHLERLIKERPPDKRRQWRQRYAKPRLDTLHTWLLYHLEKVVPNSGMHKAIVHALKRWPTLLRYLDDGAIPIDNNHVERCIRPIAIGRKNWLFAGSLMAGQRMAGIMSLLQTAKLNGIDPFIWLRHVLEKIPTWPNSRISELMPFKHNAFV